MSHSSCVTRFVACPKLAAWSGFIAQYRCTVVEIVWCAYSPFALWSMQCTPGIFFSPKFLQYHYHYDVHVWLCLCELGATFVAKTVWLDRCAACIVLFPLFHLNQSVEELFSTFEVIILCSCPDVLASKRSNFVLLANSRLLACGWWSFQNKGGGTVDCLGKQQLYSALCWTFVSAAACCT